MGLIKESVLPACYQVLLRPPMLGLMCGRVGWWGRGDCYQPNSTHYSHCYATLYIVPRVE